MLTIHEEVLTGNDEKIMLIADRIAKAAGVGKNEYDVLKGKWTISVVRTTGTKSHILSFDYNIVTEDKDEATKVSLLLVKGIDTVIGPTLLLTLCKDSKFKKLIDYIVLCDIPQEEAHLAEGWDKLPEKYDVLFDLTGGCNPNPIGSFWKKVGE